MATSPLCALRASPMKVQKQPQSLILLVTTRRLRAITSNYPTQFSAQQLPRAVESDACADNRLVLSDKVLGRHSRSLTYPPHL